MWKIKDDFLREGFSRSMHVFMRPVCKYKVLFLLLFIASYSNTLIGNKIGANTDPFLSFLLPIFDFYLVCLFAYWLSYVRMGWIVRFVAVFFAFTETFTLISIRSLFAIPVIQLVFETNPQESGEFLSSVLPLATTWYSLALFLAYALLSLLIVKLVEKSPVVGRVSKCILFVLIVWSGIRQVSAYNKLYKCYSKNTIQYCAEERNIPHLNTPFVRLLYAVSFNRASSSELDLLPSSVQDTVVDGCSFESPLIVLVIGESYNKHHTPLYEPKALSTTPRLMRLKEEGNLFVYKDAVSPFNVTSNAFKYMFSTWDESCPDDWTSHSLFPAVFKKAGYDVHFVTNQFVISSLNIWDVVGGTIFNHPTLSRLQFTTRNECVHQYDEELLADIPSIDTLTSRPSLLIFHVIGQHVEYCDRCPEQWKHFSPEDESGILFGGSHGKEIAADYDNATLYNDMVVDSLMSMFSQQDAVVLYLSDHGEEVYDWRDKHERTFEDELLPEIARYQYEIPMMFYLTDKFMARHSELAENIRMCAERPFISTHLCHLLFHLGGIETPEYKAQFDILSSSYDVAGKRILRNSVDYDVLMNRK